MLWSDGKKVTWVIYNLQIQRAAICEQTQKAKRLPYSQEMYISPEHWYLCSGWCHGFSTVALSANPEIHCLLASYSIFAGVNAFCNVEIVIISTF
jgi:hypothetical protein